MVTPNFPSGYNEFSKEVFAGDFTVVHARVLGWRVCLSGLLLVPFLPNRAGGGFLGDLAYRQNHCYVQNTDVCSIGIIEGSCRDPSIQAFQDLRFAPLWKKGSPRENTSHFAF